MPYRIDIHSPPPDAVDVLVTFGAMDIEPLNGGIAAIMPDGVAHEKLAAALAGSPFIVSPAVARDNASVWLLSPPAVHLGDVPLRLTDSAAFGTGHHPTTALCIDALQQILTLQPHNSILDVGVGSGILALTALLLGVPQAVGVDIDADSLRVAARNAQLNGLADRLQLFFGGPEAVDGNWPLVVANILAAPLIEMAPVLVRRVASHGLLILSGVPSSLEDEVRRTYQHFGMHHLESKTRGGWVTQVLQTSW